MTPPGLLRAIGPTVLPDRLVAEFTTVAQRLAGLGIVRIETGAEGPHET